MKLIHAEVEDLILETYGEKSEENDKLENFEADEEQDAEQDLE